MTPTPGSAALESLLDRLIRSSFDGILAFDRECRYTVWNPTMERLSGMSASEVVGRCAFEVFPFLEEIGEDRYFHAALAGESLVARDRPYTIPDSRRDGFFEGRYSPLRDENDVVIGGVGIIRDITDRKRAELELARSQRLESIGQFAGGVAHDFNNLLTVIMGNAHLLLEDLADQPALRKQVDQVRSAAARGSALTKQLLSFARQQVVQPRVVDVHQIILATEPLLERLLREDIVLKVDLARTPCSVKIDPGQLEQVLINLVVNARDAMPSGGTVTIESATESHVEPGASGVSRDWTVISVRDQGAGISENTREHIFEPFFTTKPPGQGTGLGLSTCLGIIEQAGGRIEVESQAGEGTELRVLLPRVEGATVNSSTVPAEPEIVPGSETILLVEDEPMVREVARTMLRAAGYTLFEADTGRQALEFLRETGARIDLLITDVVMPEMGGPDLAEAVVKEWPGTRVLFMSGYSAELGIQPKESGGAVNLIQKPFSAGQLSRKVREILGGPDAR